MKIKIKILIVILAYALFTYICGGASCEIQVSKKSWQNTNLLITDTYLTQEGYIVVCGNRIDDEKSIANDFRYRDAYDPELGIQKFIWNDDEAMPYMVIECYNQNSRILWEYQSRDDVPCLSWIAGELPDGTLLIKKVDISNYYDNRILYEYFLINEKGEAREIPQWMNVIIESDKFWFLENEVMTYTTDNSGRLTLYEYTDDFVKETWTISEFGTYGFPENKVEEYNDGYILYGTELKDGMINGSCVFAIDKNGYLAWKHVNQDKEMILHAASIKKDSLLCGGIKPLMEGFTPVLFEINLNTGEWIRDIHGLPKEAKAVANISSGSYSDALYIQLTGSDGNYILYFDTNTEDYKHQIIYPEFINTIPRILSIKENESIMLYSERHQAATSNINVITKLHFCEKNMGQN